jgi:hypothetical protein
MTADIKYPDVTVTLVGEDGNAFAILGKVSKALRNAGVTREEIDTYVDEATAGNYDQLLRTTMRWVEVA